MLDVDLYFPLSGSLHSFIVDPLQVLHPVIQALQLPSAESKYLASLQIIQTTYASAFSTHNLQSVGQALHVLSDFLRYYPDVHTGSVAI